MTVRPLSGVLPRVFLNVFEPAPTAVVAANDSPRPSGLRVVPPSAGHAAALEVMGGGLRSVPAGATRPTHKIDEYKATSVARVATGAISLRTTTGTLTLSSGDPLTVLRTFELDGVKSAFVVDGNGLHTGVITIADLEAASRLAKAGEESRYSRALRDQGGKTLSSFSASGTSGDQATVTIDMCQSSNPWNRELYVALVDESKKSGKPIPVGIAMTGLWARAHPSELAQILKWQDEGALDITWINHSDKHQVGNGDFLTNPAIDFAKSVLDLEKTLLQNGAVPSLLFRFPGLWHDDTRRSELQALGMFGLDADAWLGKGQRPVDGSVILIHGNGNTKRDVPLFFSWRSDKGAAYELVSPLAVIP